MIYPQSYAPVTGMDRVSVVTEENGKGKIQQIKLEIGASPMFFTYLGPTYDEINNITLCQGKESLRENIPRSVDRRGRSLDENQRKEYKIELEEYHKKNTGPFDFFPRLNDNNKGFEFDTDRDGLIVTYFDVAYEGIRGNDKHFVVGHEIFYPARDLKEAIRMSQRQFTLLDKVYITGGIDNKSIEVPQVKYDNGRLVKILAE
ncbi:MAG: hypothetical protein WC781_00815 [Candidatus Pacearchaeota archaeon]|jgi:hypothetical protein